MQLKSDSFADGAVIDVRGALTGANGRAAPSGHVLAQAQLTGTYTRNPRLR